MRCALISARGRRGTGQQEASSPPPTSAQRSAGQQPHVAAAGASPVGGSRVLQRQGGRGGAYGVEPARADGDTVSSGDRLGPGRRRGRDRGLDVRGGVRGSAEGHRGRRVATPAMGPGRRVGNGPAASSSAGRGAVSGGAGGAGGCGGALRGLLAKGRQWWQMCARCVTPGLDGQM